MKTYLHSFLIRIGYFSPHKNSISVANWNKLLLDNSMKLYYDTERVSLISLFYVLQRHFVLGHVMYETKIIFKIN